LACGGGYTVGRVLVIDAFPYPEFGRAVVCGQDGDCPQFAERAYGCRERLCESKDSPPLDEGTVLALCLATVARPSSCSAAMNDPATQAGIAAANTVCGQGGTCTMVPPSCRQL
jgi:hypothetical protein